MKPLSLKKTLVLMLLVQVLLLALVMFVQQKNLNITNGFAQFYEEIDTAHHLIIVSE